MGNILEMHRQNLKIVFDFEIYVTHSLSVEWIAINSCGFGRLSVQWGIWGPSYQQLFELSLNVFAEFSDKNISFKKIAVLEPTISCVRDRDFTTATQRHN